MVGTASNTPVNLLSVAANTTGGGFNNGANPGSVVQRIVVRWQIDPTVTAATVVINGSSDGSTYATPVLQTAIAASKGSYKGVAALAFGPAGPFVGFNAVLTSYAGSGNVVVDWADEEEFDGSGLF